MPLLTTDGRFPSVNPTTSNNVTVEERTRAIDFINRSNHLFEEFDHDKIISTFLPDCTVYHFHGTIKGQAECRRFLEETYGYLIPGVARLASNHIVDGDAEGGGVVVRYHEHLIRNSRAKEEGGEGMGVLERTDGLPAIWLFTPMIDRLRMTDDGWKIWERYVGAGTMNGKLSPKQKEG